MAFTYPVNAPISQHFGQNPLSYQPQGHYGVDFACNTGTTIMSIGPGVVMWADWSQNMGANPWQMIPFHPGTGINVIIDHGEYVSIYAHLDSTPMNIGDRVAGGQSIGRSGNTGNSTGPHLHLELIYMPNINGFMYGRVDPLKVMTLLAAPAVTKLAANQRLVGKANVNQRAEAKASAKIVRIVPANTVETFSGFVRGERVNTGGVNSDIWFKDSKGYVWAGGFTTQSVAGLTDLTPKAPVPPIALLPTQRRVGAANINQRDAAATSGKVVRTILGNTVETFTGFVRGEPVTLGGVTSDVWFKDSHGYAWAGGFTSQATAGLTDQTPKAPAPTPTPVPESTVTLPKYVTKTLIPFPVNFRREPVIGDNVIGELNIGAVVSISGWANAYDINGSKVWLQIAPGNGWIHSSMVTNDSLTGIPEIKLNIDVPAAYNFKKDFDFVEYFPAHTSNMQDGNFPEKPTHVVLHQFNARDLKPGIDGVISHFQAVRPGKESSAHFAVSEDRIVQLVGLKDRAFHAGTVGNDYIGIEVDPDQDPKTVASVKKLLAAIREKYGYLPIYIEHKDVPGNATTCGEDIDLDLYTLDKIVTPVTPKPTPEVTPPKPEPVPAPDPTPAGITAEQKKQIIREFMDDLIETTVK